MQTPNDEIRLFERVAREEDSAADKLDRMFRDRLCALVEREMNARYRRREDPEDVVQSVFRTFFRRAVQGEFQFDSPGGLWALLQKIARNKIVNHVQFHQARVRDITREKDLDEQVLHGADAPVPVARVLGDALEVALNGLEPHESEILRLQLYGLSIGEIIQTVLRGLSAPYPEVLQLRLQGHSERQIAELTSLGSLQSRIPCTCAGRFGKTA